MSNNPFMETFMPSIEARQNAPSEELFYQIKDLKDIVKRSSLSFDDKLATRQYLEGLREVEATLLTDYPSKILVKSFYDDTFARLARLRSSVINRTR